MLTLQSSKHFTNAVTRAKSIHPKIKYIEFGTYAVKSGERWYLVSFGLSVRKQVTVECNCKAGQFGHVCWHAAAAAQVHLAIFAAQRKPMRRATISREIDEFRRVEAEVRQGCRY